MTGPRRLADNDGFRVVMVSCRCPSTTLLCSSLICTLQLSVAPEVCAVDSLSLPAHGRAFSITVTDGQWNIAQWNIFPSDYLQRLGVAGGFGFVVQRPKFPPLALSQFPLAATRFSATMFARLSICFAVIQREAP